MNNFTRRDLVAALPALTLLSSAFAQSHAQTAAAGNLPDHCKAWTFAELPSARNAKTGNISHPVTHGTLPTGEIVELHETTLAPGQVPHPPHHHTHTEFMLIREGRIEYSFGGTDDAPANHSVVGPGGVIYARSGETHGIKNIGTEPANYFVIAIGSQVEPAPKKV